MNLMRMFLSGSRMDGSDEPDAQCLSGSRMGGSSASDAHDSSGMRSHSNMMLYCYLFLLQVLCTMFIALH